MKLSIVICGLFAMCAVSYAQYLQQVPIPYQQQVENTQMVPQQNRQKRSLLLGGLGAAALGAGIIGAGAIGAGALGAGIIGAKAGFVGGALASKVFSGRSYGGGYGGGYGYGHGGGYGGSYYAAAPVYVEHAAPVVYRSYQPSYYVEDEWC
ncbi:hypothetical protein O0L34_g9974 [Tuta absoluta]|nr:hypothetical protein O0L34_g9974 [Tuta absoluta]